jgi:dihydrolipoamide dehydrogenase
LAATGVATNERGVPKFDPSTLQCGDAPIFLAGDIDAQRPVLHEASSEGAIAGRNAASFPNCGRTSAPCPFPSCSRTLPSPRLATAGSPPSDTTLVGSASYADQGRARIEARNAGLLRIYDRSQERRSYRHHAFRAWNGPHRSSVRLGDRARRDAAAVLALPFYHPTFEEGLKLALRSRSSFRDF